MKKIISVLVVTMGITAGFGFGGAGGCGGGADTNPSGNENPTPTRSFSESGSALTVDRMVNGSSPAALSLNAYRDVVVSSNASFYYGRFIAVGGGQVYSGAIRFKLNKENDTSAYFSDFSLEHYSRVTSLTTHEAVVLSPINLDVPASFSASANHVEIADATRRFVDFDVDFGNNVYFGDIQNAGVIFSSDFTTMAGGNGLNFFFIAQKSDSQPDASIATITDDFTAVTFRVNSGIINLLGASTVNVAGFGGNGLTAFSGRTYLNIPFNGEIALNDAASGAFFFGYGAGTGVPTADSVDGAFLLSADGSLALGVDLAHLDYFAAEKR